MLRLSLTPLARTGPLFPGLPDWLCRLLWARGVESEEAARQFLHPDARQLLSPEKLHQLSQAAALIREAAAAGKRAVIYGDYDVDGVSASAILWEALGMLGMERQVYLPDRHQEGYGLNIPAVETLAKEADLLITVDCGITSVEEVKRAKELGMTVVVTDHHRHLPEALPPADAVISPLLGEYPFPSLCGAGVAWKLALALAGEDAFPLIDLAAMATVADMVPLLWENRVIVSLGLQRLGETKRPGLRALMKRAGLAGPVTSDQVAFQIAPRMNACGRMESARTALNMLLTRDPAQAEELALKMEGLNQDRRSQENNVLTEAQAQAAKMDLVDTKAIVVWGEGWNSGVVGLAAGKLAEQYACPTVALAVDGEMSVGSARSAGDIDIHQALSQCADLFLRFGGHKQAAGLTLRTEHLEEFSRRLSLAVGEQTGGRPVIPSIPCDGELALSQVTEETVAWLSRLEPFGMGNPAPRFLCRNVQALSLRAVGAEGRHLKCSFQQGSALRDGIFFGGGDWAGQTASHFSLAFSPTLNEFRGKVSAECRIYGLRMEPETLPEDPTREALSLFSDAPGGEKAEAAAMELADDWMQSSQGTLLLCRCRETALALLGRYPEADFCLRTADDPRAFSAVLLYGSPDSVRAPFRRVLLCDGDMGEAAAFRAACPRVQVAALPDSPALKRLLAQCFTDKDSLRRVYVILTKNNFPDLYAFAAACGLTPAQGAFALRVLDEIGLIHMTLSPFRVALLPMQKRGPEESALFRKGREIRQQTV